VGGAGVAEGGETGNGGEEMRYRLALALHSDLATMEIDEADGRAWRLHSNPPRGLRHRRAAIFLHVQYAAKKIQNNSANGY
jgi:hypothetical protein